MTAASDTNDAWHDRARRTTPAGVHSNARLGRAGTVFVRGEGPWLFDADGNRYVDYMLGRGPAVLGHSPSAVNDAVARAVGGGLTLGQSTPLEVEATEAALSVIPWADQLRFVSSGTEAVQAALRLARAATGRPLIVQFEGMYHGWLDGVSLVAGAGPRSALPGTAGQSPDSGAQVVLLPWDDVGAVDAAFAEWGDQIAAVITEPLNIFGGREAAPGYLAHLRDVTTTAGALLIFDEVVTGFRLQPGSAASLFGVTPDLGTYAKGMGSGWPVAAVAGTAAVFEGVASDQVRLSGTYNGNAASMAAVIATVGVMADGSVHAAMAAWGDDLRQLLDAAAGRKGVSFETAGAPTAFWSVFPKLDWASSGARADSLGERLWAEGVVTYHHTWLTSAAHNDEVLTFTLEAFERALSKPLG
ncbi:MAG: aminotransferase class III-fold pyridoxal phosphate-dependent enzyme [Actinomycetota bacterium]